MTSGSHRAWNVLHWIDNPSHGHVTTLPFPLVTGELAHLRLPIDLLPEEASRMADALKVWAVP